MAVKVSKKSDPSPTRKTTYNKGAGLPGALGELGNFFIDSGRTTENAASNAVDWLSGTKKPNLLGDRIFGRGPQPKKPAGRSSGGSFGTDPSAPDPGTPTAPEKTFADYLAEARSMTGGGGPDYTAQINNTKAQAGASDARLAAMYKQLQDSYAADAGGIQQNYDATKAAQLDNAKQASEQTAQGYSSARDAQSKQLAALGIQDAAGVLASQGGNAARDAAVANSNIAQNQLANVNQTDAHKASALTYNTRIGQAAGAEGASQRATLQNTLAAKLAELQTAQSQASSQGSSSALSLAGQLADFDNAAAQRRAAANDPMAQIAAQQAAANLTKTTLQNQNYAAAQGGSAVGANLAEYQKLAVKYGVDPADSNAFGAFVKLVNSTK